MHDTKNLENYNLRNQRFSVFGKLAKFGVITSFVIGGIIGIEKAGDGLDTLMGHKERNSVSKKIGDTRIEVAGKVQEFIKNF